MRSSPYEPESYDCVVIVTAHSAIDYDDLVDRAQVVVDLRNATGRTVRRTGKSGSCDCGSTGGTSPPLARPERRAGGVLSRPRAPSTRPPCVLPSLAHDVRELHERHRPNNAASAGRPRPVGKEPRPQLRSARRVRLLCDVAEPRRADLAGIYPAARMTGSYEDILADDSVEAIVIATPVPTHPGTGPPRARSRQARLRGEARGNAPGRDGRALRARRGAWPRADARSSLLYHPGVQKLKEIVDSASWATSSRVRKRQNLGTFRTNENALWSLGVHDLSVLLHLIEEEPSEVEAHGNAFLSRGVEERRLLLSALPLGKMAHMHLSWLDPHKIRRITVVGNDRMAVFDDMDRERKITVYDNWRTRTGDIYSPKVDTTEPLRLECQHFLRLVAGDGDPHKPARDAIPVVRALEQLQASLETVRRDRRDRSDRDRLSRDRDRRRLPDPRGRGSSGSRPPCRRGRRRGGRSYRRWSSREGTIVSTGAIVFAGTRVGARVIVGDQACIRERCVIGDDVVVGRGALVENDIHRRSAVEDPGDGLCDVVLDARRERLHRTVRDHDERQPHGRTEKRHALRKGPTIRRGARVGAGAVLCPAVEIGEEAFVGAGAVVVKDVPPHVVVVGNPARTLRDVPPEELL